MPHTIIQYTATEVEEILTAHAIGLVAGNIGTSQIQVEFSKLTSSAGPEDVIFTRARVIIPQSKNGPRRSGTVVEQPGPVPPRRIETADDIRLAGGLGSGIAGERSYH